jgi:hypothetical protein
MFGRQGKKYRRHCGPTAAVNVFSTLLAKEEQKQKKEDLFLRFVRSAQRKLIYVNADLFGLFGGTMDLRAGEFLRGCSRISGISGISISRRKRMEQSAMLKSLAAGNILYLELIGHPVYGRHHMVCYGASVYDHHEKEPLFRIADGWQAKPVYKEYEALGKGYYIEIKKERCV